MKNLTKLTLLVLSVFLISNSLIGQESEELNISGVVYDENEVPLPGANIIISGTKKGVQTDFDGRYEIPAKKGSVLVFSYLGYTTQRVTIEDTSKINITLQTDISGLDQIVVIGYGSSSKKRVTASISTIRSSDIEDIPSPGLQSVMTSKISGVQITQISGKVESGIKVRIRGISTIGASQEPLYVIDGVPVINDDESINNSPINPLIGLNTSDIESIDFLKDASSAAIYGARGTNGVIIITTKQGKANKTKITFSNSTGWSEATHRKEMLNAEQYVELFTEAALNSGLTTAEIETKFDQLALGKDWRNGNVDTDWQDLALVSGNTRNINLSASGGTEKVKYYFSTSYDKTEGIIRGNELDRYTLRGKVDTDISEKTSAGFNISLSKITIDRLSNDNTFISPLQSIAQSPLTPALLDDGTANVDPLSTLYANFLGQEQTGRFVTDIWRTTLNVYGEHYFLPSFKFRSEIGYDANNQNAERFSGSLTESASINGFGIVNNTITERYILTNYFNYKKKFGENFNFSMTVGGSFEETNRKNQFATGSGFPSDNLQTISSALFTTGGSTKTKYNFLSYFARSKFDIKDTYLFNLSIRQDGSSRFGENSKTGWFPAASGAWIVSNENFLSSSYTLSKLKLRASWGVTGNAGIGNFASRDLYAATSYAQRIAITPSFIGDPNLKWERTTQVDFGLDFGLFNNTISGEFDYYEKETNDLLVNEPIPGTSGFSTVTRNVGSLSNKGIEFSLKARIITKPSFIWNTSTIFSMNKNEITDLPNGDIIDGVNIIRKGESISSFYLYEYAGVDSSNGDALFYTNTVNSNGSLDRTTTNDVANASKIIKGNPFPNYQVGFTNSMKVKDFDFQFTFQGEFGASIYNQAGRFQSGNARFFDNQTVDQLDRWQNPGDITQVPQARLEQNNGQEASTRYLQEADFIRLRNITLGYTINPEFTKRFFVQKARFYFSGLNLLTFTDYEGYDPESTADFNGNSGVRTGIANYSAPPAKTYTLGINIEF